MNRPHHATRRGRAGLASVAAAVLALAPLARAQTVPDQARAHDAFERGSAAFRTGDYARAATEYARADALDPNPAALRAAIDAATLADDPVLGTELIERAARAPADGDTTRALDAARARFAHRTGRVAIRCGAGAACLATIDGAAVNASKPSIVAVGPHTIAVQSDVGFQPRIVNVAADETVAIAVARPAPPSPPAPAKPAGEPDAPGEHGRRGLSPAYFLVSAGVTAAVGGVALWSVLDARQKHSHFVDARCDQVAQLGCDVLASDGQAAQTRTNVLLGVTGALAVTTVVLDLFVDWRGARRDALVIAPNGPGASLRVGF